MWMKEKDLAWVVVVGDGNRLVAHVKIATQKRPAAAGSAPFFRASVVLRD